MAKDLLQSAIATKQAASSTMVLTVARALRCASLRASKTHPYASHAPAAALHFCPSQKPKVAVEWAAKHLSIGPADAVHLVAVLPYEPVFGAAAALATVGAGVYPSIVSAAENDIIGEREARAPAAACVREPRRTAHNSVCVMMQRRGNALLSILRCTRYINI